MLHGKLFSYIYRCPVNASVSKPAKPKASASGVFSTLAKTAGSYGIAILLFEYRYRSDDSLLYYRKSDTC